MFTTALWFSLLLVSRAFADLLVCSKPLDRFSRPPAHSSARFQTFTPPNRSATPLPILCVATAYPGEEAHRFLAQFKNSKGETPCTVVLQLLVPCNVNVSESSSQSRSSRTRESDVADCNHQQPLISVHPPAPGAPPPVLLSTPLLTSFLDSNIEFYNLLSACALLCVKQSVDPFYEWTESCDQIVPMTRDYPYTSVITTVIPPWASKQLSSGGNFDPSIVMGGEFSYLLLDCFTSFRMNF